MAYNSNKIGYAEASKRLENSNIASLKDLLQKTNIRGTQNKSLKDWCGPTNSLHFPLSIHSSNPLSKLHLPYEETTKQLPFKIRTPKVTGNSFWVNAKLKAIA